MILSAIGVSDDIELDVALERVLQECSSKLGHHSPQVGILFTSCMDADFADLLRKIQINLTLFSWISGCRSWTE